jgi:hypothetical protein
MASLLSLVKVHVCTSLSLVGLCFPCKAGSAEWVQVDRNAHVTILADKSTLRKAGATTKFWTLTNFAKVQTLEGKRHQSAKTQFEVDCEEERFRVLATTFYAQTDGRGAIVFSTSAASNWEPVAPETIASGLKGFACSS